MDCFKLVPSRMIINYYYNYSFTFYSVQKFDCTLYWQHRRKYLNTSVSQWFFQSSYVDHSLIAVRHIRSEHFNTDWQMYIHLPLLSVNSGVPSTSLVFKYTLKDPTVLPCMLYQKVSLWIAWKSPSLILFYNDCHSFSYGDTQNIV